MLEGNSIFFQRIMSMEFSWPEKFGGGCAGGTLSTQSWLAIPFDTIKIPTPARLFACATPCLASSKGFWSAPPDAVA